MKRRGMLLFFISLLWLHERALFSKGLAEITFIQGQALVETKGKTQKARKGMDLNAGDKIKTSKAARLEIKFFDGSIVRLGSYSVLVVHTVKEEKDRAQIQLLHQGGRAWHNIAKGKKDVTVQTPTAMAGVKGTVFRTDTDEEVTTFRVYEGKVEVKSWFEAIEEGKMKEPEWPPREVEGPHEVTLEEWVKIVESMQQLVVRKGEVPSDPEPFDFKKDQEDPWVQWNLERDKKNQ